jgi:phosphatidylinositol alpha-1,6-mannosyltransferase
LSAELGHDHPAGQVAQETVRVLVLTPDFPPARGGIQSLVHGLVRHWQSIDASVLTIDTPGAREFDRNESIHIRRIGTPGILGHRGGRALLNLAAVVEARRFRPHAVLSAHIVTSPAAWAIRHALGVPFVQYLHFGEGNTRPGLARFAVRQAAGVVAVSRSTEALALARGATPGKVHRIPPGVELPEPAGAPRSPRPLMVTVSRLHDPYKGHDVLIRALPWIRARVPDVLWVVIGDGRLRPHYERAVDDVGLSDHVRFLGTVSDSERDAWLDRAHVFVMPSRSAADGQGEGFGIAYLEAAAHGLPSVAGNVDGTLDAVVDGETGLLVDPTDPAAVAGALIELLLDQRLAERLGRAAAARAQTFGWPGISAQVEELLTRTARA